MVTEAIALFALGWALRLESKQSATATKQTDMAETLNDIKDTVGTVDGKVDQLIMRLIPQAQATTVVLGAHVGRGSD